MANLTTGIFLRSKTGLHHSPIILLFSEYREGVDTLFTLSRDFIIGGNELNEKVLAQQGAYGSFESGWHYTKEGGTNVDFCTVADVLEYHGLEYLE